MDTNQVFLHLKSNKLHSWDYILISHPFLPHFMGLLFFCQVDARDLKFQEAIYSAYNNGLREGALKL